MFEAEHHPKSERDIAATTNGNGLEEHHVIEKDYLQGNTQKCRKDELFYHHSDKLDYDHIQGLHHNSYKSDQHNGYGHSHGETCKDHDRKVVLQTSEEPTATQKKIARLEWENITYREELEKLAAILKTKTLESNGFEGIKEENERLRGELAHVEHIVIQLQGENDTIGKNRDHFINLKRYH